MVVGLLPEELGNALAAQCVGGDKSKLRWEPTLTVSASRLRATFCWLSTNCWPWMGATKFAGVESQEQLGDQLEDLLAAYWRSVGGAFSESHTATDVASTWHVWDHLHFCKSLWVPSVVGGSPCDGPRHDQLAFSAADQERVARPAVPKEHALAA